MSLHTYVMKVHFKDGACFRAPIRALDATEARKRGNAIVYQTFGEAELLRRKIVGAEIYTVKGVMYD